MKKLLLILFLVNLYGCCKDCTDDTNPDCSNYNPCKGKTETSAEFKIFETIGNRQLETDIIFAGLSQGYTFKAIDSTADEYLWEIGTEKITTKSVYRRGFPIDKYVSVKLTVKRNNPFKKCFPNDSGVAVVTKSIYSAGSPAFYYDFERGLSPTTTIKHINGKYRGHNNRNPNHILTMEYKHNCQCFYQINGLGIYNSFNNWTAPSVDIVNLPYEGLSVYSTFNTPGKYQNTYGDMTVDGINSSDGDGQQSAKSAHGSVTTWEGARDTVPFSKYYSFFKYYLMLDPKDTDKVTMEYWYRDTITRKILKDTFVGVRIP